MKTLEIKKVLTDQAWQAAHLNEHIRITGWVRSARHSKAGISFIEINDGSSILSIQVVSPEALDNYCEIKKITTGVSVTVSGLLVESMGKGQDVEIQAKEVTILGAIEEPENYPIAKKRHTFEYLRGLPHLRIRTNTFGAIARIRSSVANKIHNYFFESGFHWVSTPIITPSDCEGAGELFKVSTLDYAQKKFTTKTDYADDFFGRETFLTVSGQLNAEAYCLAMSKVYTFGPTFRAENSNTSRHLSEFWMVEPEIAFADLEDNATLAETLLKTIIEHVLEFCSEDLSFLTRQINPSLTERLLGVFDKKFEKISYTEAVEILEKSKRDFQFPVEWGLDLQSEHERFLTEDYAKGPLIVSDYPKDIKAFYMRLNDDGETVSAMDVLVPGIGEIIGGSQREERLHILDSRIQNQRILSELSWYRDLRKYGTVPHAGFGLGFERLISYITGMENIRDCIPFPRAPGNAKI